MSRIIVALAIIIIVSVGLLKAVALVVPSGNEVATQDQKTVAALQALLVRQSLQSGSQLAHAEVVVHSAAFRDVARAHHLTSVNITPFETDQSYQEGLWASQTYPRGKTLVVVLADQADYNSMRLALFFDYHDHLLRYTTTWAHVSL